MVNTLHEDNCKVINTLLEDFNIDPETMLRELLVNFMSSQQAFDFLAEYVKQMDICDHFPQFRDLDENS